MTRWDMDLSATGNQAKIIRIANGVSTATLYPDKDVALALFNTDKASVKYLVYSDYTGYLIHHGNIYGYDVRGVNVMSDEEVSYPTTLQAESVTSTSFIAVWYKMSDYTYQIDVSTSMTFNTFVTGYNNLAVINGDTFKAVTGLTPATDYYYRVRCKDSYNNVSRNSKFIKVTTL